MGREPVQVLVLIDYMHTHKIFWILHTEKNKHGSMIRVHTVMKVLEKLSVFQTWN